MRGGKEVLLGDCDATYGRHASLIRWACWTMWVICFGLRSANVRRCVTEGMTKKTGIYRGEGTTANFMSGREESSRRSSRHHDSMWLTFPRTTTVASLRNTIWFENLHVREDIVGAL